MVAGQSTLVFRNDRIIEEDSETENTLMNAQGAHYIAIDQVLSPSFGANYSGPDLLDVNG